MNSAARQRINIVVLEPDPALRHTLHEALEHHGLIVKSYGASEDLDAHLDDDRPDLILTENRLPTEDAISLSKRVLMNSLPGQQAEVIVMYDQSGPELFQAHEAGICHLLHKPVQIPELLELYRRYCSRNARRAHERVHVSALAASANVKGAVIDAARSTSPKRVQIGDIGRGGFYFEVEAGSLNVDVGDVLNFEIDLSMVPRCRFQAQGVIRWLREGFERSGAGVEFASLDSASRELLSAYIDLFKVKAFVPSGRH